MGKGLIIKELIKKSSYKSVENFAKRIDLTKGGLYYKINNDSFTEEEFERFKALLTNETAPKSEIESKYSELESKYLDLLSKYTALLELLAKPERERLAGKRKVSKDNAAHANIMQLFA